MHAASDLITSSACMIQACTSTCKSETHREKERKNYEKKDMKEKRK
jgi:hypothetical protein